MAIKLTEEEFNKLKKQFLELGQEGLYLSHYDLAKETFCNDPQLWKAFLMDPRTVDYIHSEMTIVRNATINKMVSNAADSNSVGQSQLLNTLGKLAESSEHKEGPAFIYCYVPLNNEQKYAPNVRRVNPEGIEVNEDGTYTMEI